MPKGGALLVEKKGPNESFLEPQSVPGGWLRMMSLEGQYPGGTTHLVTGPGVVIYYRLSMWHLDTFVLILK